MMMIQKNKPWRSKKFLSFCHENMKPAQCCVCQEQPWSQLHHFGDDGGTSMKPSDNEVARVCLGCHNPRNDLKRRGLIKSGRWDLLEDYQNDALKLNRAYAEHLESVKHRSLPPIVAEHNNECAVEELSLWLVTEGAGLGPDEQLEFLLKWANRRSADVIGFLTEPMKEIAASSRDRSSQFVAKQALKTAGLGGTNGENKN